MKKTIRWVGALLAGTLLAVCAVPAFAEEKTDAGDYQTNVSYEFRESYTIEIPTSYILEEDKDQNLIGTIPVSADVMLETGKQLVVTEQGETIDGTKKDGVLTLRNGDNAMSGTVLCDGKSNIAFHTASETQTKEFNVLVKPDAIFAGNYTGQITFHAEIVKSE